VDGSEPINFPIEGHTFGVADQRDALKPLGLSAYQTTTAVRKVRLRRLPGVKYQTYTT
jgi:hypothetical protein